MRTSARSIEYYLSKFLHEQNINSELQKVHGGNNLDVQRGRDREVDNILSLSKINERVRTFSYGGLCISHERFTTDGRKSPREDFQSAGMVRWPELLERTGKERNKTDLYGIIWKL